MVSAFCVLFKKSLPTPNLASLNSGSLEAIWKLCIWQAWKILTIKLLFRNRRGKMLREQKGRSTVVPKQVEPYRMPWRCVEGGGNQGLMIEVGGGDFSWEKNNSSNLQTNLIYSKPCTDTILMLFIKAIVNSSLRSCCNFPTRVRRGSQQSAAQMVSVQTTLYLS